MSMPLRPAQSRAMSMIEAIVNVLIGFWISMAVQALVYPAFGIRTSFSTDFGIAAIFTLVSIARSFVMRRVFERLHPKEHTMSNQPLPVAGYTAQSDLKVELVNANKELEERVLRQIDALVRRVGEKGPGVLTVDGRWLAIAKTQIEQGFMALNRAIFQPTRINLPEDNDGA